MRLRPRGSSSDLEEARAIAERLGRPLTAGAASAPGAPAYVRFGGTTSAPAHVPRGTPGAPAVEHVDAPAEPTALPGPAATPPAAAPPAPPMPVEIAPPPLEAESAHEPEAPLPPEADVEASETTVAAETGVEEPLEAEASATGPEPPGTEALVGEAHPTEAEPAIPEPLGAEALVGESAIEQAEPLPEALASASAESLVSGPPSPTAEWEVDEEAAGESPLEALSEMVSSEPPAPRPPSWDALIERAKELADAQAAMLIGPDGALLAATEGWPAVGAAAIAAKLLPMVEPKLANPGALVPVKLAGQILSVWRFEVEEQPVTAAVLAEKALPVIVRPDVDELFAQGTLRG